MYPTKEEILKDEVIFRKETIPTVKEFKEEWTKTKLTENPTEKKKELLEGLLNTLAIIYKKPLKITFKDNIPCCYNPRTKTINIDDSLSIVTTLHEFAHHILGQSEKKACIWSVWLFKKSFPKAYDKLGWNGHMLTKK